MRYLHPGAYFERDDAPGARRLRLRTDVAAFVGIAERGPLDTPVPLLSFRQFQTHFGGFIGAGFLAYAVRGFFENGGRRCWVVRVASRLGGWGAVPAALTLADANGPLWRVRAASPGRHGNALMLRIDAEQTAQTEIDVARSTPLAAAVRQVAGFARGTLVRISQPLPAGGISEQWRVVSAVDAGAGLLWWRHPEPGAGLPYDRALGPLDGNRPARIDSLSWRLSVYREGRLLAGFGGLSPVPEHPGYGPRRLAAAVYPTGADVDQALAPAAPIVVEDLRADRSRMPLPFAIGLTAELPLRDGRDGLARLRADDFIGVEPDPQDSDAERAAKLRGIEALAQVDEIALVAVPDILIQPRPDPAFRPEPEPEPDPCLRCPPPPPPRRPAQGYRSPGELPPVFGDADVHRVQAALIDHCRRRGDRFAVLDAPSPAGSDPAAGLAAVQDWRRRFDTDLAALYYPWVLAPEPRGGELVRPVPACGHVLGQFAFFDNAVGVHRAPGNRTLAWVRDLSVDVGAAGHAALHAVEINLLRRDGPRGPRPMGVRTLSSDPDWRHINVRRLMLLIRKALYRLSEWAVFEPNNAATRNRLRVLVDGYLAQLFRIGAFAGATPEQAYFVRCDEITTSAADRDNGRLIALVGVAPSRPFEFIVVRIGVEANALAVGDEARLGRAA